MDLSQLKHISNSSYDTALHKQNALHKAESDCVTVYHNHIFRADAQTICLVRTLAEHQQEFIVLDANHNPVKITDPAEFLKKLIEQNQSALNTYHQLHEKLKHRKV
jgi:hypothetical protein